ncbi:MAG TPA: lytic transglycosylase domain-containing protein [Baekduia sp.]|uniref:lytic transglycosylase domain-containing protein n=1 Tax=Baekduia sp. TaxID=2600305 RepID=UPI002D767778|nr:lytic transglycosylase domain-containing protein [Baekduia sp.]HET6507390.1 lytic transglycosylase domain-containing protein [Baekduia sp.]
MKLVGGLAASLLAAFVLLAAVLTGWTLTSGAAGQTDCAGAGLAGTVPAELQPLFNDAAKTYALGAEGPAILAGLTKVESDFGRNMGPSSAGAVGWTQFMPGTWRQFGVDSDGDGRADPMTAADAIMSAARYLKHLGAPGDWHRALLGYNHAEWYVRKVLDQARSLTAKDASADASLCTDDLALPSGAGGRLIGGGRIVPIPGEPGMTIDERLVPDIQFLRAKFHVTVTAGYAPTGHAQHGEHPLGLAVDLVPGRGGTWDDVDALARWAEPQQNHPRPPFRWVGYDGDSGHGRGNHLHLSWIHGAAPNGPPAPWVQVLIGSS